MRSERNFTLTVTPEVADLVDTAVFGAGNFLLACTGAGTEINIPITKTTMESDLKIFSFIIYNVIVVFNLCQKKVG